MVYQTALSTIYSITNGRDLSIINGIQVSEKKMGE